MKGCKTNGHENVDRCNIAVIGGNNDKGDDGDGGNGNEDDADDEDVHGNDDHDDGDGCNIDISGDNNDDVDDDDDDGGNDGDIYIMMQCLCVCHEKSSLPPGSLL